MISIVPTWPIDEGVGFYDTISDFNQVIPLQALTNGTKLTKGENKTLLYDLRFDRFSVRHIPKVSDFFGYVSAIDRFAIYSGSAFSTQFVVGNFLLFKYTFVNNAQKITPLMVLGVKQKYLFKVSRNNIDPSMLCLVVDKKMLTDEELFKVYRNLKRYFIDELDPRIDIMYVNDVMDTCYTNVILPPKIKRLTEVNQVNEQINQELHEIFKERQRKRRKREEQIENEARARQQERHRARVEAARIRETGFESLAGTATTGTAVFGVDLATDATTYTATTAVADLDF